MCTHTHTPTPRTHTSHTNVYVNAGCQNLASTEKWHLLSEGKGAKKGRISGFHARTGQGHGQGVWGVTTNQQTNQAKTPTHPASSHPTRITLPKDTPSAAFTRVHNESAISFLRTFPAFGKVRLVPLLSCHYLMPTL